MPVDLALKLCRSAVAALLLAAGAAAHADTLWKWSYTAPGIVARGTLTTTDAADAEGYHRITGIDGKRNGEAVVALAPAGRAIPGNDGYPVDNRIRYGEDGMLTIHGLGLVTASGAQANAFFDGRRGAVPYREVFSRDGKLTETDVLFTAAPVVER
ncbi:hypothetical protein [Derxia lacustris]|uniref:hypothetical protein n=1 Tax=Derxia lacustris TaxID=764842 RepID=UPI000A170CB5|nr:hypothetical protein [Derxia lacustris]